MIIELRNIKESLPEEVEVRRIEKRLCALANCIVCNDDVALAHPKLDQVMFFFFFMFFFLIYLTITE